MNEEQPTINSQQPITSEPAPQPPAAEKPPKSKKKWLIVLGIVSLLMIATIVAALMTAKKKSTKTEPAKSPVTSTEGPVMMPETITAKIKSKLAEQYTLLDIDKNNNPGKGQLSIGMSEDSPVYKLAGHSVYTNYDGGSMLTILTSQPSSTSVELPSNTDTQIRNTIIEMFEEQGLARQNMRGTKEAGTYEYLGKGLVCTVDTPETASSSSVVMCGLLSKYAAAADKIKPLADVLPNKNADTILSNAVFTASKVSGYQRAEADSSAIGWNGGSKSLFYKKEGSPWKHFRNAQEAPSCSDYTTVDLRNAFKGEACFGDKGEDSTVQ